MFVCTGCQHRDESWKKFYTEYLKLYTVKSNWAVENSKVSCVLGLFCHLYREKYGVEYLFVPASPNPFKAKECKDAWMIIKTFNDIEDTRKYLIWAFKTGLSSNTKITSLAYLKVPNLIRKFMLSLEKHNALKRFSVLPDEFISWCRANTPTIFDKCTLETMNDLGALLTYTNTYAKENDIEKTIIEKATSLGLIKEGKLNTWKN